jgi:hypothetical protein
MVNASTTRARHGITLLEVLISLGILTIGLASVAALIPAGRSQAIKATIYDRGSTLAANAAADLISRGFLRTEKLVPTSASTFSNRLLIYDPLFDGIWGPADTFVTLRDDAATSASSGTELAVLPKGTTGILPVIADILFRSEDDPIYGVPEADPDAPPQPGWSTDTGGSIANGRRGFDGTYSYLVALETGELNPPFWLSGRQATMTIVVFHRRDPSAPPFALVPDGAGLWVEPDPAGSPVILPDGDTIRDVVKPGSMVLWGNYSVTPPEFRWFRTLIVMDQSTPADGVRMGISCEGSDPPAISADERLYILPGAVAGLQLPVTLEGSSEWSE